MQALFYNTFVVGCLLCTQLLFAHSLTWTDMLSHEAAQQYVLEYKDIAVNDMHKTGIPASIKLAQAMFESNFGRSDLAIKGNNHFGIKCYKSWKGGRLFYNDDKPNECFRQYDWVDDSYADHSRIITTKKRYASLFELAPIDYKGWAKGLQKKGYATDPQYAEKLIWMIEKHDLHQYDFEEDPFIHSEDGSIIAAKSEVNNELDGPIIYAYKFGDVHKVAPNKLKVSHTNSPPLLKHSATSPKEELFSSTSVIPQNTLKKNKVISTKADKNTSEITHSPFSSQAFLHKRPFVQISTLPQQFPTHITHHQTTPPLTFNKIHLPQIPYSTAREEMSLTTTLNVLSSKPLIHIESNKPSPTFSFNKRKLPQIPFSAERVKINLTALPTIASKPTIHLESDYSSPTFSFNKRALPELPLIEEDAATEITVHPPIPSPTIRETVMGNPSAISKEDAVVMLSKKEVVYLNKLQTVQYEKPVNLKDVAHTYQISFDKLMTYNDLSDSTQVLSSHLPIYLESKKSKPANNTQKEHIVEAGETIWEIAQQYGIQMEDLMARNYLNENEEPRTGEVILLRSQAPYPPKIKREKPKANVSKAFKEEVLKEIREN